MRLNSFLFFLITWLSCLAFEYPSEWNNYMSSQYIYALEESQNNTNEAENVFVQKLSDSAISNLARQFQVKVSDNAVLSKVSVDGRTSIRYSSKTGFSSDINLKLVTTRTNYNKFTKRGFALAYVNIENARNYYCNEFSIAMTQLNNSIASAKELLSKGLKANAKTELESTQTQIIKAEEAIMWLNLLGYNQSGLTEMQVTLNNLNLDIKLFLADMAQNIEIYLKCNTDLFGKSYSKFENELISQLNKTGCTIGSQRDKSDWEINISCKAREFNKVSYGKSNAFIAYVDAQIEIIRVRDNKKIYQNEISMKGAHSLNYTEAAKQAYKDINTKIATIIRDIIEKY